MLRAPRTPKPAAAATPQPHPPQRPRQLSSKFPAADPLALDLLGHLLAFDPADRPTAAEALAHPYFAGLPSAVNQVRGQPVCAGRMGQGLALDANTASGRLWPNLASSGSRLAVCDCM